MAHDALIDRPPTRALAAAEAADRDRTAAHLPSLAAGTHGDPFAVLGPHRAPADADADAGGQPLTMVRAFVPFAESVRVVAADGHAARALQPQGTAGFFSGAKEFDGPYRLAVRWPGGIEQTVDDPYRFGLLLGDLDLHLIAEGRHHELARCLGAQAMAIDDVAGVRFAVWAPNARRVSVVGDFNAWNGLAHPMRRRSQAGVWELFLPGLRPGARYKFELLGADGSVLQRADPVARATEPPPATASVVADPTPFVWTDADWLARRAERDARRAPMSVYELHAGSWLRAVSDARDEQGRPDGWRLLAERLIPYAKGLGFTHIELLPVAEHPFGGSWGYQPLGLFAPTARYGTPEDFAQFVDRCHAAGLGVLVDWVPAHFPTDLHGLAHFDGTALYEHADPREGFHQDWNTLIYNLGRNEVRGFMIASALEWLEHFHVDGLRVDAVASMLYRDYSRKHGEWVPNQYGGRENLENVAFLREFTTVVRERCPGCLTIAEESTSWPGVTAPVDQGGLGFDFKWNMGWMHDSLRYMANAPIHRGWHHDGMSFSMVYAFSEAFVLPLSHDEVVHGKGSLLRKMPGDAWQQLANLRAYYGFMWTHPGKKLLFMGCEIGQPREWNHDGEIDWSLLDDPAHAGLQRLVHDLNTLHTDCPALHVSDTRPEGFAWVVGDDRANSVFAFLRRTTADDPTPLLVAINFTPVPRTQYRIGVPSVGRWRERLNTDATAYGGSGLGNGGAVDAEPVPAHGQPASVVLTLPPLAALVLELAT